MDEVFLVFGEVNFSESFEDGGGTEQHTDLRAVANSVEAAVGLIFKDYWETLQSEGLAQEAHPLVSKEGDEDGDDYFEVTIRGSEGTNSWTHVLRWYIEAATMNELIEE